MKNIIKYISIFSLTLVFTKNLYCQDIELKSNAFTINQLQNDFNVFRESLEESHIGLYLYNSKTQMDSIFNAGYASIKNEMTAREFTVLICKITSQIGDGHMKITLPEDEAEAIEKGPTQIPFRVYYYENKLFVFKNFTSLPDQDFLGAEITSINGHSMIEFMKEYLSAYNADGKNLTMKYRLLSRTNRNSFTYSFNLLYGYQEKYNVSYIPINDSITKTATFQGIYLDSLLKISEQRYPKKIADQTPIFFEVQPDSTYAYLRVKSFMPDTYVESKINYEKFLKKSFSELATKNIQNLILDLRDNPGGEKSELLYSYFAKSDFRLCKSVCMNKQNYDCYKYPDKSISNHRFPKKDLKPNSNGTFDLTNFPDFHSPSLPTFNGKIFVLMDGACYSATSELLSMLHSYTNAVFIGEESGGMYYGNVAYWNIYLQLPNTAMNMKIPIVQTTLQVKDYLYTDRGLMPNYTVVPTVEEKMKGIDPEFNFVMKLILKK